MIYRRSFLAGLGALMAAPAIVHAGNMMQIKGKRLIFVELEDLGITKSLDSNGCIFDSYTSYFRWNKKYMSSLCPKELVDMVTNPIEFRLSEDVAAIEAIAYHENVEIEQLVITGFQQPNQNIFEMMRLA